MTSGTSVTVTATVLGEISSAVATTTEVISEPTFWEAVIGFLMFWI